MFPNSKTITFQFKEITPQDVARRVQRRMPAVNASTVYRTLEFLVENRRQVVRGGFRRRRVGQFRHLLLARLPPGRRRPGLQRRLVRPRAPGALVAWIAPRALAIAVGSTAARGGCWAAGAS